MKVFLIVVSALTVLAGGGVQVQAQENAQALEAYQQQVGFQRRVALEEARALEVAYNQRNNTVHISKDLRDLLAYGISSGWLGYRFLNKTDNLKSIRDALTRKGNGTTFTSLVAWQPLLPNSFFLKQIQPPLFFPHWPLLQPVLLFVLLARWYLAV